MNKYEQLIEFIINEQEDKARELFHSIVVEKSREIYENLIDESDLAEMGGNDVEQMVDEITMDEEGMAEDEMDMDGDDMDMDPEAKHDEFGGDDHHADVGGDEELEDRVMDLEDALDELKAEFDSLMGQEAGEVEHDFDGEGDMDGEDEGDEDLMYEAEEEDLDEAEEEDLDESRKPTRKMTEAEWIREYVEKVGEYPGDMASPSGKMVGTGAKSEKQGEKNTKSPNGPGANMGGHVVKTKGGEQDPDGKQIEQPNNEYSKNKGDLPHAGKFKNVPGGDAGKSTYKTKEAAYGSGKQASASGNMAGTGKNTPKQGEGNTKSPLKHIAGK